MMGSEVAELSARSRGPAGAALERELLRVFTALFASPPRIDADDADDRMRIRRSAPVRAAEPAWAAEVGEVPALAAG